MALTTVRALAFSSGGLESLSSTIGTPSGGITTNVVNTKYAIELGSGDQVQRTLGINFPDDPIFAFKIRFSSVSPSADVDFFDTSTVATSNSSLTLRLKTNGDIALINANSVERDTYTGLSANTTYQFAFHFINDNATGLAYVYVDGSEVLSQTTSDDFRAGEISATFNSGGGITIQIMELFCGIGDLADLNTDGYDVYEFAVDGTGFTTSGDALDAGTWDNTGEQPLSETNTADYTGTPKAGHAVADGTILPGPSGAGITGTVAGAEWWFWASRGNGGGTTHTLRYGNDVDTINTQVFSPISDYAGYSVVSDAAGAVPLLTENFAMGMEVSGAKDLFMGEMYAALAVEISAGAVASLPHKPFNYNNFLVR